MSWPTRVGDFPVVVQESPGVYRMEAAEIAQTGANVVTHLRLPKRHVLINVHMKHLDAARAENMNALALRYDKELRVDNWDNFFTDAVCTNYDLLVQLEQVESETTIYRVQTNTTLNHIVVVTFKVEARD